LKKDGDTNRAFYKRANGMLFPRFQLALVVERKNKQATFKRKNNGT